MYTCNFNSRYIHSRTIIINHWPTYLLFIVACRSTTLRRASIPPDAVPSTRGSQRCCNSTTCTSGLAGFRKQSLLSSCRSNGVWSHKYTDVAVCSPFSVGSMSEVVRQYRVPRIPTQSLDNIAIDAGNLVHRFPCNRSTLSFIILLLRALRFPLDIAKQCK